MKTTTRRYIIVKFAQHWEEYFDVDPRHGCHASYNAAFTFTGSNLDVPKEPFDNPVLADEWCEKMIKANSTGGYAVCTLLEEKDQDTPTGEDDLK